MRYVCDKFCLHPFIFILASTAVSRPPVILFILFAKVDISSSPITSNLYFKLPFSIFLYF